MSVGDLYNLYATYPYLTRLRDKTALTDGLLSVYNDTSWSVNGFAFAYGWDDTEQECIDLHLPTDAATSQLTDSTLIVKPDLAQAQREREAARYGPGDDPVDVLRPHQEHTQTGGPDQPKPVVTRYWGAMTLNPDFPAKDFSTVQQEILHHLAATGLLGRGPYRDQRHRTVAGFDEACQRTVRENGNTLGFDDSGFDIG